MTKEEVLAIVQGNEWNIQVFNGTPLYLMCAASRSGWMLEDVFGVGYTHFFYLFENNRAHMYYDEKDWAKVCDAYFRSITSLEQLNDLMGKRRQNYQDLVEETRREEGLEKMSDDRLVGYAGRLCNRLTAAVGYSHAIEGITFGSEKRLRVILKKKRAHVSEEVFGILCTPVAASFLLAAQQELWSLRGLRGSAQQVGIEEFLSKFGWIENTYLGAKNLSNQDVMERAKLIKEKPDLNSAERVREQKETWLDDLEFTDGERFVVETIETCFHWQDDRKKYILQTIDVLDPVIELVAKRFSLAVGDLKFATAEELLAENLKDPDFESRLKLRRSNSAFYSRPDADLIFVGTDYKFLARELDVVIDTDIQNLRGVVAAAGVARGVVRVCESVSDIDKVQNGEILVASMTRPEYLPAMQKAAAFVTDEGGITSHAAIVARELNKPCIIGTKYATRVLKDGDEVEVDADSGVVRKISNV